MRARRAGADGRIKKPFGQEELVAVVNKFITQAEALPPPPPPKPVIVPVPPAAEVEPMDLPPELSTRMELSDFGTLSEGTPFGEPGPEEAPPPAVEEARHPWQALEEAQAVPPPVAAQSSDELSAGAEPQLVEEPAEVPTPAEPETPERTLLFRMPVEIAPPVLADDLAPAPPVGEAPLAPPPEAPAAEPELAEESAPPPEEPAEVAVSPEPPAEAETFTPTPAEAAPSPASPPETSEAAIAEPPAPVSEPAPEVMTAPVPAVDTDLVYWIVHNVVVRMAPPALSTAAVEELIRQISDEMITELSQPPPEAQS